MHYVHTAGKPRYSLSWLLTRSPLERSREVTLPFRIMLLELDSERESQKRMLLSKWPLMIVDPELSSVTRSLQLDPANLVSMPEKCNAVISYVNFELKVQK